jgi:hypothetical protein
LTPDKPRQTSIYLPTKIQKALDRVAKQERRSRSGMIQILLTTTKRLAVKR